jgi:hypothetical protein
VHRISLALLSVDCQQVIADMRQVLVDEAPRLLRIALLDRIDQGAVLAVVL